MESALSDFKGLRGKYTDLVKNGSPAPLDHLKSAYFSGVIDGFRLVWKMFDEPPTEEQFDTWVRGITNQQDNGQAKIFKIGETGEKVNWK